MTGWRRRRGVGPAEAADLVAHGAVLLDVREPHEWAAGRAPGARHLPLGQLSGRANDLPADTPIVVVCRRGHRSARATAALTRLGFDAVNLDGGMLAWQASGRPVVGEGGRPGTVS